MNPIQKLFLTLSGVKQNVTLVPTWQTGVPTYLPVNYQNIIRDYWRKNELIYACIMHKASTASQVTLKVYNKKTSKVWPEHPLQQLLRSPNPAMSEYDLWRATIIYQDLAGRAAFEKERNKAGQVIRLWPLRPDWLHPVPSSINYLSGYQYTVPGVQPQSLDAKDVLDIKMFDPLDQYNTWPPVAVASRVGQIDNAATDYIKLFFEKGGTPPGIIKTTQKLRDTEVEDIRKRWGDRYGGIEGWLNPAVLDRDADYQKIGMTFKEMGFDVLDARDEAKICAIIRVPPIIVGAKVGLDRSTYTNYKEARTAWWEDTLVPIYVDFISSLYNNLVNEWDDCYVQWDFTNVPALREEKLSLWQRANEALRWGGITINEYREQIGFEAIGPEGDIFMRPLNVVQVGLDGEVNNLAANNPTDQPAGTTEGDVNNPSGKAADHPNQRQRSQREKRLGRNLSKYLAQQREKIEKELADGGPSGILG